jgi:WD40 repeat protein
MSDIADAKETVKDTIRYWQTILDELDRRAMEYSELLSAMKAKEEEGKRRRDNAELILKFNLRGTVFNTAKDTALKFENTYFTALLSSPLFELDINGEFFIDRISIGFDRILDYMSTGELCSEGLNRYDKDCVYDNLVYFKISHKSRWDYSKVSLIDYLDLKVLLQLKDGRLCGYRDDDDDVSICIYNMDTNIIELTWKGHTDNICAIIQLEDGRICSCSDDETIKLWSIESGQCVLTIDEHAPVNCIIQLTDGRLCSGPHNETIKVWSKDTGVCQLIINTNLNVYCFVQLRNGSVCSGHYGNIQLWNIATGLCEMTLSGHSHSVRAIVVIDELRICSCSDDKTIKTWNVSTGVCERTVEGLTNWVRDMVLLLDERLCSVSYDGSAKIWIKDTGACELSVHISKHFLRNVVQLHDGRVVATDVSMAVYMIGD